MKFCQSLFVVVAVAWNAAGLAACGDGAAPARDTVDADSAVTPDSEGPADTDVGADTSADTGIGVDVAFDDSGADTAPTDAAMTDTVSVDVAPEDASAPDTVADVAADTGESGDIPADVAIADPTFQRVLPSWSMAPGEERTRCIVVRLGNDAAIDVHRIRTRLAPGSHHFIVYRSSETRERPEPFDCQPFTDTLGGGTVPLMISQIREETLDFPEGVAVRLEANQMLRLEAHFLNYFPQTIEASAEVVFETTTAPNLQQADFMFYGTTQVWIPAGQTVTSAWKYHSVPSGVKVFGMTGHTHALGTNVEVQQTTGATTPGSALYPPAGATFDWAEAPYARFEPPLSFADDGFRMRCTWTNTTQQTVGFGESANQEMCFFWAYYYPSQGFLVSF
jgi:hypothetical protein